MKPLPMIIDGKTIAAKIQKEIAEKISHFQKRKPGLAVILVGNHPASEIYVKRKTQACAAVGILSVKKLFPTTISEQQLLTEIEALNRNPEIDGILVQLPLPPHINTTHIINAVSPEKDVDGFHPLNMGKLLTGDPSGFLPCTPLGIKTILDHLGVETAGKHAVVVGRSNIVGKPIAAMLMQTAWGNATVTVVHSQTKDLPFYCRHADLLITAIGKPQFIKEDMIKENAIVIDVGINRITKAEGEEGTQVVGDVDFEKAKHKCSITPVPGGVGPMTIAMLLSNTLKSYQLREKLPANGPL